MPVVYAFLLSITVKTMLRHAARRLFGSSFRAVSTSAARFADDVVAAPAGPKEFTEQWNKQAPSSLELPQLPSNFTPEYKEGESQADGERFPVNFYTPHSVISEEKVRAAALGVQFALSAVAHPTCTGQMPFIQHKITSRLLQSRPLV